DDLSLAKVTRAALHERVRTRKRMTFHDLRATGITWAAIRGDDTLKIMARAGHETYGTMLLYVREAEIVREGFGQPFPPLPEALWGGLSGPPKSPPTAPKIPQKPRQKGVPKGIRTPVSGVKSRGPGPLDDGDRKRTLSLPPPARRVKILSACDVGNWPPVSS